MKNIFLIIFTFFSLAINANSLENPPLVLNSIESPQALFVSYYTGTWNIGLENDTFWEIFVLKEKRKQTVYEWWNNITPSEWLLDDNFFITPGNWKAGDQVQVFTISGGHINTMDGFNYVLHNITTDEKAFARDILEWNLLLPKISYIEKFMQYPLGDPIILGLNQLSIKTLLFQDDQIWKPRLFNAEWCSFSDWWNNIPLDQPDEEFVFQVSAWQAGDVIQIYCYEEIFNGSLQKINLLRNLSRNQYLYADPLSLIKFAELFQRYSEEEYQTGYNAGYASGRSDCNCDNCN